MDALISSILQSEEKETSPRTFDGKLPYAPEDVEALLLQQYRKAVEKRGRRPDISKVREHIRKTARWLTDSGCKRGLIIAGTNGSGKSTMAQAIYRTLTKLKEAHLSYLKENRWKLSEEEVRKHEKWEKYPAPVFYPATKLTKGDSDTGKEMYVIIDDLGTEPTVVKNFGTETTPVVDILTHRYDRLLPTVITTNMTKDMIEATYGKRIEGRLHELCNELGMDDIDYRHEDK